MRWVCYLVLQHIWITGVWEKLTVQRLSTKSNLKLAKLWLDRKEYSRLHPVSCLLTAYVSHDIQLTCLDLEITVQDVFAI